MPGFDSTRGSYAISAYYYKFNFDNNTRLADSANVAGNYYDIINAINNEEIPSRRNSFPLMAWNNSNKLLTVTPNGGRSDFRILFFHHK